MKRALCAVLAVLLLFISCACGENAPVSYSVIQEMIRCRGYYGAAAKENTEAALKEISRSDAALGERWKDIMALWDECDAMTVNEGELPEGLPEDDSFCIVVLGFELNADGSMQDELIGRLTTALRCTEQYPNALVVCTGGGTARNNRDVTEAGQMSEWLLENGLAPERLIREDRSLSTAQNAAFTYAILKEHYPQVKSLAIVSSAYHIAWGTLLFETALRMEVAPGEDPGVHVITNAAFPIFNEYYADTGRFMAGGLLQMMGFDEFAMDVYGNKATPPTLNKQ